MNTDRLIAGLKSKTISLYRERFPEKGVVADMPDFDARIARIRMLSDRVKAHGHARQLRNNRRNMLMGIQFDINEAARMIKSGARIMCFDVEWVTGFEGTHEIGVSVYQNGVIETFNYRAKGGRDDPRDTFEFGETELLTEDEVFEKLRAHGAASDAYVGHSLITDFRHIASSGKEMPRLKFFDTAWWSSEYAEHAMLKLSELCVMFEVAAPFTHSGGNDSRYNMEVFLEIVKRRARV